MDETLMSLKKSKKDKKGKAGADSKGDPKKKGLLKETDNPKGDTKQPKTAKKDSELEHLEIKRKAIMMKNRWTSKLQELDQDITLALSRGSQFEDCEEFLSSSWFSVFIYMCFHDFHVMSIIFHCFLFEASTIAEGQVRENVCHVPRSGSEDH